MRELIGHYCFWFFRQWTKRSDFLYISDEEPILQETGGVCVHETAAFSASRTPTDVQKVAGRRQGQRVYVHGRDFISKTQARFDARLDEKVIEENVRTYGVMDSSRWREALRIG